ncbi:unnamed protein product [Prunus armeniaca]|uniref:Uncharacterized protein n=1 Tax=Prunus armeniaca TaxID=36596 RepID=A0A6J5TFF2_PRUAR|nr:unnamed protein product [Prunus armeniaca]
MVIFALLFVKPYFEVTLTKKSSWQHPCMSPIAFLSFNARTKTNYISIVIDVLPSRAKLGLGWVLSPN